MAMEPVVSNKKGNRNIHQPNRQLWWVVQVIFFIVDEYSFGEIRRDGVIMVNGQTKELLVF